MKIAIWKAGILLFLLVLAGCAGKKTLPFPDYATQLTATTTASKAWLAKPKDTQLLDLAKKQCNSTVENASDTDCSKLESYKELNLLKALLDMTATQLASGGDPTVAPPSSRESPVETVFSLVSLLESDLQQEQKKNGATASASPTP